jgi:hypothetical protein
MLAFLGAGAEPPRRYRSCGVSAFPHLPQESSTLPFQPTSVFLIKKLKVTIFKKDSVKEKS